MAENTVPCIHDNFECHLGVNRLLSDEEMLVGYAVDIDIECADCGIPFEFVGLPLGRSPAHPTSDPFRHELRAPITPCTDGESHSLATPTGREGQE